jgi:hypothetical protein
MNNNIDETNTDTRLPTTEPTAMSPEEHPDEHSNPLFIPIERFCVEQTELRARLVQGGPTPMPDGVPTD